MSTSAASTLTRPRISVAIFSAAAAASIGYFLYRAVYDPPLPEPEPGRALHRSNAVRHRRRAPRDSPHGRSASGGSSTSSAESHTDEIVDENAEVTVLHPLTDGETVAEEQTMGDDWWNDPSSMPQQRAGQNIVSLLFRVSEDNARRNAYVHRGCMCNACGIVPIRGIRYRCANCADFDLCETCESQGLHFKTHVFYKVKIPAPPFGPRHMQPVWYPGDPESCLGNLPRSIMVKLSKETGFERPELEAFWEQWTFIANTEWREDPDDLCLAMDRKTFERCLVPSGGYRHTAPNLIYDRMFSFYDTNNDDLIGFTEFLHGLSYRKRKDKLRKIFDGYDIDKDGLVNRRDFLRVFRAYYVLYKQMHKDILEGQDDQVMSTTDAHQLVTGRQPISSFFGREGRVPSADGIRHMGGKVFHSNGDVLISDGKGVVSENKPDTADRGTILTSLFSNGDGHGHFVEDPFSPTSESHRSPTGQSDPRYLSALINPPTRVAHLSLLLRDEVRPGDELFISPVSLDHVENGAAQEIASASSDAENSPNQIGRDTNHLRAGGDADETQSVYSEALPVDIPRRRHPPSEAFTDAMPTDSQIRAQHQQIVARSHRVALNKRSRVNARRKLLERWKRRQFYLDEEEGAEAPDGWGEEDDILASMNGIGESSKAAQALSPRSRSSSKVRFAEDTDDYEIRSNPSTSSRSVPERWGGMEIPDAERDAGKEILYQVTQQAFNELLDILFKAKEDLAVEAAETKALRAEHRALFESIDLAEEDKKVAGNSLPPDPKASEPESINDGALTELLEISGYRVDESLVQPAWADGTTIVGEGNDSVMNNIDDGISIIETTALEVLLDSPEEQETAEQKPVSSTEFRDPTMPQFRANSPLDKLPNESQPPELDYSTVAASNSTKSEEDRAPVYSDKGKHVERQEVPIGQAKGRATNDIPTPIPHETLVQWKRIDVAESMAEKRRGWGMLTFEEFEAIYKKEEAQANRLDYLGSWIDFCIP